MKITGKWSDGQPQARRTAYPQPYWSGGQPSVIIDTDLDWELENWVEGRVVSDSDDCDWIEGRVWVVALWDDLVLGGATLVKIISSVLQVSESTLRPRVMARIKNETVQISEGIIGAITEKFYVGSGDGRVSAADADFSVCHDKTTGANAIQYQIRAVSEYWSGSYTITRSGLPVFTDGIPDNSTILSARLWLYISDVCNDAVTPDDGLGYFSVVQSNQASVLAIALDDFDDLPDTAPDPTEACDPSDRVDISAESTFSWVNIPFNSTGIGWINKQGWTKLAIREGHDIEDDPGNLDAHGEFVMCTFDTSGDSNPPYLEVTYTIDGPNLLKIINETLNLSEDSIPSRVMARIINSTLQLSEGSVRRSVLIRIINSVLQLSGANVHLKAMSRVINETEQLSETSLRPRVMTRIKNETEQISEGKIAARVMKRIINSTVQLSEGIVDILTDVGALIIKVINETLQISEAKNRLKAMFRFGNDTVSLTEGVLRPRVMARIINETLSLVEGTLRPRVMVRVKNETESILETSTRLKAMVRTVSDTLGISETHSRVLGFVRIINETVQISEVKNKVLGFIKIVNETLNISESVLRFRALVRFASEIVNVSETNVRHRGLVRIVTNFLNIVESTTKTMGLVRLISESVNISENTSRIRGIVQVVGEIMNISEAITRIMTIPEAIKKLFSSVFNRIVSKVSSRNTTVSTTSSFDKAVEAESRFQRVVSVESEWVTEEIEQ